MNEPTARLMLRVLAGFEEALQARLHADGFEDVTVAQTNVLRHLDPGGMRQSELARDARITKQAVSQAVRALEARDLVEVAPDPHDARAKRVVYTPRGRALIQCALGHILAIEQQWCRDLEETDYVALRRILAKLDPRCQENGTSVKN